MQKRLIWNIFWNRFRCYQQKKVKKQDRTKNGRARSEEAKKQHTWSCPGPPGPSFFLDRHTIEVLNKIGILKICEPRSGNYLLFLKKVSRIHRILWPQVTLNRRTRKQFFSGARAHYFAPHNARQYVTTDRHAWASNPGTISEWTIFKPHLILLLFPVSGGRSTGFRACQAPQSLRSILVSLRYISTLALIWALF